MSLKTKRQGRVLLIEQDPEEVRTMSGYLETWGYEVLRAEKGRLGLDLFRVEKPDIVLVDIDLEDMEGIAALAEIRRADPCVPVVMLSGDGRLEEILQVLKIGAWGLLTKPITRRRELFLAVEGALSRASLLRENRRHQERLEAEIEAKTSDLEASNIQLRDKLGFLEGLMDAVPIPVFFKDLQGAFIGCNRAFEEFLGAPRRDLVGKTALDIWPQEQARLYYQQDTELLSNPGRQVYQSEVLTRAGKSRDVVFSRATFLDHEAKVAGIVGAIMDVTDRNRVENELRRSEARFRELVETMNEGLVVVDGEGLITYCNQRFADLLGLEREGLEGRDAKQVVGPEFRVGRSCRAGGQPGCRYELDLTPAPGGQRTVSISIAPVFGEGARFTGSLSVIADMTEVRLLEQKLNQAHRLESVGQLAAGIAHEINTPAQYVFNNVKFLKDTMPGVQAVLDASAELARLARDSGPFAESAQALGLALDRVDPQMFREDVLGAIDETLEGITRISWIVQSVKRFAHPGLDKIVPTDLNEAIGSTVTVSTNEWKYVADLDLDLDPALPLVPCVPGELNQFLLNLITNAAHSIGEKLDKNPQDKGRITVSTGLAGDRVEIRVKDTGQGIPESIRSRIFDPFFTTKPVGRGTGQGLSIARTQITERLGGEIDFETEEGVGTTFIIRLPLEPRAEAGPDAGADAGE